MTKIVPLNRPTSLKEKILLAAEEKKKDMGWKYPECVKVYVTVEDDGKVSEVRIAFDRACYIPGKDFPHIDTSGTKIGQGIMLVDNVALGNDIIRIMINPCVAREHEILFVVKMIISCFI